jgi:ATP-dependent helicase/nuclease subunit A
MIYDAKRDIERPLRNRDIVILLRSAKDYAEVYYEALMKGGDPAFVDASDGYFYTIEVEVFLNLVRVIDNRKQVYPAAQRSAPRRFSALPWRNSS